MNDDEVEIFTDLADKQLRKTKPCEIINVK